MQYQPITARRPSWRGILAGLIMGLVVSMTMLALALVLGSFLSLDLRGAGITAGIYAAITALLSAFVAGYFAVKASAPEALFGDGTDILPKDATLIGILTAATIVVITTFSAMSGVSSAIRTAGSAIGTTTGAVGSVIGSVGSATAGLAGAGVTAATATQGNDITTQAQELYQKATGNINRQDIENWIAKNNETFNQEQVAASANVLENMLNKTKNEVSNMDFTSLDTWKNLDEYAKKRANEIEGVLTSDEIIVRLKEQGLSDAEAQHVRNEVTASYQEYKAQTEQTLADAKLQAEQALQTAEDAARKTALYSGLFWLISTLLTFLASILGAKKAAANYRLVRPLSDKNA